MKPGQRHERADAAPGRRLPRDDTAHEQNAADGEVRDRESGPAGLVEVHSTATPKAIPSRQQREPRGRTAQPTAAASASPESSLLGMKLQAGLRRAAAGTTTRPARDEHDRRVDASPASRSATAKPSRSGSWMSRRTTSGRSSAAGERGSAVLGLADHVEAARLEECARRSPEAAWSSTISTVRPMQRTVAEAGHSHIGALLEERLSGDDQGKHLSDPHRAAGGHRWQQRLAPLLSLAMFRRSCHRRGAAP